MAHCYDVEENVRIMSIRTWSLPEGFRGLLEDIINNKKKKQHGEEDKAKHN